MNNIYNDYLLVMVIIKNNNLNYITIYLFIIYVDNPQHIIHPIMIQIAFILFLLINIFMKDEIYVKSLT
jgi:hypothetical protein